MSLHSRLLFVVSAEGESRPLSRGRYRRFGRLFERHTHFGIAESALASADCECNGLQSQALELERRTDGPTIGTLAKVAKALQSRLADLVAIGERRREKLIVETRKLTHVRLKRNFARGEGDSPQFQSGGVKPCFLRARM
jgi:hypothetical protein